MNIWWMDLSDSVSASATDAVTEYFLKCWKPFAMYIYPISEAIIAIFKFL